VIKSGRLGESRKYSICGRGKRYGQTVDQKPFIRVHGIFYKRKFMLTFRN
jgi:hypothetical protein